MEWKSLIRTLQEAGVSQAQIAASCGCAQSTISDLARGKINQPNFDIGRKLEALHKKKCKRRQVVKAEA